MFHLKNLIMDFIDALHTPPFYCVLQFTHEDSSNFIIKHLGSNLSVAKKRFNSIADRYRYRPSNIQSIQFCSKLTLFGDIKGVL